MTSTPLSNRSVPQGPSTVSRPVIIFVQNLSKRFHKVGWTWKGINYKVWDAFQKIADPQRLEEADPHWMSLTLSQLEYQQLKTGFPDLIHAYEETSPAPVVVLWEWLVLPLTVMRSGAYDVRFMSLQDFVLAVCASPSDERSRPLEDAYMVIGGFDLSADFKEQMKSASEDNAPVNDDEYIRCLEMLSRRMVVWPDGSEMLRAGQKAPGLVRGATGALLDRISFLDVLDDVAHRETKTRPLTRRPVTLREAAKPGTMARWEVLKRGYSGGRKHVYLPSEYSEHISYAHEKLGAHEEGEFADSWLVEEYAPSLVDHGTWVCYFASGELVRTVRTKLSSPPHISQGGLCEAFRYDIECDDLHPDVSKNPFTSWSTAEAFMADLELFARTTYEAFCNRLTRNGSTSDYRLCGRLKVGVDDQNFFVYDVSSSWGMDLFGRAQGSSVRDYIDRIVQAIPAFVQQRRSNFEA